jgi:hypothetical protein
VAVGVKVGVELQTVMGMTEEVTGQAPDRIEAEFVIARQGSLGKPLI